MPTRRKESEELERMAQAADKNYTIKNSPFGTSHTSQLRYKIVGSKLMPVVEDGNYPSPVHGGEFLTDFRRRPIPEKPNHIWPSQVQPPLAQQDPALRDSPRHDKFYDSLGHVSKPQNDPLHPFSVLPPVRNDQSFYPNSEYAEQQRQPIHNVDETLQDMIRRIPGARLPNEPVKFSPNEVSYLLKKVHQDLEGYVSQRLKDIYVEMTTFDRKLSGLIHFDDFVFAARKHQLRCDPAVLRLIASMFVVPSTPNFVNYEKILSFIGAALKSDSPSMGYQGQDTRRSLDPRGMPHVEPHETWNHTPRSIGLKTGVPHGVGPRPSWGTQPERNEEHPPQQPQQSYQSHPQQGHGQAQQQMGQGQQPYVDPAFKERRRLEVEGNQAKLLSILHEALKDYSREDFNRLVDGFYLWDREKKGTLTVEDIKTVAYRQNLRVTNSVINALLDMCYVRWDQYDWRKFVKYVEAALPTSVGQDPEPRGPVHSQMTSDNLKETMNQPVVVPSDTMANSCPTTTAPPKQSPRGSGTTSPSSDAARAWFDRFMRLSKALYTVDSKYVGHLPPDDVRWITNEYNRVYELGLYEPDVEEAINVSSTHSGLINIDSYLRSLSLRGHY